MMLESKDIQDEIDWCEKIIVMTLEGYFREEYEPELANLKKNPPRINDSFYAKEIEVLKPNFEERLTIALALTYSFKPQVLNLFLTKNSNTGYRFVEFGGTFNSDHQRFTPTLETAKFLVNPNSIQKQLLFLNEFNKGKLVRKHRIFSLDNKQDHQSDSPLILSSEFLRKIYSGKKTLPKFSQAFPAQHITTSLNWEDLVISENVKISLQEVNDWLENKSLILEDWGLKKFFNQGYKVLFSGPPGTGKTLAASLIGKSQNLPVFRIDLSMMVSKYIGETEKNLSALFDTAQDKDWILFFDEADALFGKRSQTNGSNDRFANQEVSYLLQRIEDFQGLIILASNFQENIDPAFSRRFQNIIDFHLPDKDQRKELWMRMLFKNFESSEDIDIEEIAKSYELSGGSIVNILRYVAIQAAKRGEKKLKKSDVITGIKREFNKQQKSI